MPETPAPNDSGHSDSPSLPDPDSFWNPIIENAQRVALGDLAQTLASSHKAVGDIDRPLEKCNSFQFLDRSNFKKMMEVGSDFEAEFFWCHFHQLLIVNIRAGCAVLRPVSRVTRLCRRADGG